MLFRQAINPAKSGFWLSLIGARYQILWEEGGSSKRRECQGQRNIFRQSTVTTPLQVFPFFFIRERKRKRKRKKSSESQVLCRKIQGQIICSQCGQFIPPAEYSRIQQQNEQLVQCLTCQEGTNGLKPINAPKAIPSVNTVIAQVNCNKTPKGSNPVLGENNAFHNTPGPTARFYRNRKRLSQTGRSPSLPGTSGAFPPAETSIDAPSVITSSSVSSASGSGIMRVSQPYPPSQPVVRPSQLPIPSAAIPYISVTPIDVSKIATVQRPRPDNTSHSNDKILKISRDFRVVISYVDENGKALATPRVTAESIFKCPHFCDSLVPIKHKKSSSEEVINRYTPEVDSEALTKKGLGSCSWLFDSRRRQEPLKSEKSEKADTEKESFTHFYRNGSCFHVAVSKPGACGMSGFTMLYRHRMISDKLRKAEELVHNARKEALEWKKVITDPENRKLPRPVIDELYSIKEKRKSEVVAQIYDNYLPMIEFYSRFIRNVQEITPEPHYDIINVKKNGLDIINGIVDILKKHKALPEDISIYDMSINNGKEKKIKHYMMAANWISSETNDDPEHFDQFSDMVEEVINRPERYVVVMYTETAPSMPVIIFAEQKGMASLTRNTLPVVNVPSFYSLAIYKFVPASLIHMFTENKFVSARTFWNSLKNLHFIKQIYEMNVVVYRDMSYKSPLFHDVERPGEFSGQITIYPAGLIQ